MGKESGLGANLYVDGVDLSNDYGAVTTMSKSLKPIPQTGIDKFGPERKGGQLDGEMTGTVFFNPTNAHVVYSTLTRNDRIASYLHRPILGSPMGSIVAKQMDYAVKRETDGGIEAEVQLLENAFWFDWGLAVTAGKRTDGVPANGTGVDFGSWGAPNNFGLQAYLHVFAFTGTSVTIKLQGSSDNAVGDPYADIVGGGFTLVNGVTKERIATARNLAVERWVRVVTTGTFSNVVFAVGVTVNQTDMTI